MPLQPGQRLGPYEVLDLLGAGGMGEVYRAHDPRLGREVAIKILRAVDDGAGERRAARLEREARTVAALEHPNVLTLYDVGRHDGALFLVTELLRGESLRARLDRDGALGLAETVRIGEEVARGLAAAHALGVVHRDLKPDNVFLTADGRVKILDFGLASPREESASGDLGEAPTVDRTLDGTVLGTAPYLSPEQARGERAEARSDLFALGIVLHECLTGVSPFRRASYAETLSAVLVESAPSLAPVAGAGALARLIERCLAKRPELRPPSAAAVAEELATAPGGSPMGAPAAPPSVAVLPFADMSAARDQEHFCDGMAEEILHALTRVEGLRVTARTSSFQFRGGGHDLREVGAKLGVATVLEGSVRRAGDRLRVTVQLIDVGTGYHLWSERFDRGVEDVFAIQDEIAASVARALSTVLTEGARRELRRRGTQDVAAYEAYLRGRQLAAQHRARGHLEAVRELGRALELDPGFAAAWAGLADSHGFLYLWHGHDPEDLAAAERASARALELDPEGPDSLVARAHVLMLQGRNRESEQVFERALERAPEAPYALYLFARLRFTEGRMAEAAELFERGATADPDDYQVLCLAHMAYESLGLHDRELDCSRRALERIERRLEIAPADVRALYLGAGVLVRLGQEERARAWLRRALEIDPGEAPTLYNAACIYVRLGCVDEALDLLEQVVDQGFGHREWVEQDTDLAPLRDLPRFRALLAKLR